MDKPAMSEEQKTEEGKKMFSIFAARMFEQRVLQAYREKVAQGAFYSFKLALGVLTMRFTLQNVKLNSCANCRRKRTRLPNAKRRKPTPNRRRRTRRSAYTIGKSIGISY